MEKVRKIWCVVARSRVKNSQMKFDNPMILCAYEKFDNACSKIDRLNTEDEFLEWEYTLELTTLHKDND